MTKIVLVALLAAAACGGKKRSGSDCDAAIAKGIDNYAKVTKEQVRNPQIVEQMMGMVSNLKGVLTARCKTDDWPAEVVSCFSAVSTTQDMQACESKLSRDQQAKLNRELAPIARNAGAMGMGQRMPPGMPGHPEKLMGNTGSGAAAAPGTPPGSDPSAAPGAAAPASTPPAPADNAAPPPASGSAPK
jgi:small lipoprotein (TIGR04454 family)